MSKKWEDKGRFLDIARWYALLLLCVDFSNVSVQFANMGVMALRKQPNTRNI